MGKTVLLADDDKEFRGTVAVALERAGINVVQASDGMGALEHLSRSLPDLIISDLNMPVMDGETFCRRVRAVSAYNAIPFVILSAMVEMDGASLANIPADLCLSKQSPLSEILSQLQDLIAD
ncbi:MAG: response regulator [Blastocatellia bacterium]|nr:response regulator [Blastocatellia bacterium]